jgi:hypothetical protein
MPFAKANPVAPMEPVQAKAVDFGTPIDYFYSFLGGWERDFGKPRTTIDSAT